VAFTGAGISVESGVPPFRGEGGLWDRFDPRALEIDYFLAHPKESWRVMREIYRCCFHAVGPNECHRMLARLERDGPLRAVVTQNIDGLHQAAGSERVIEYHGNVRQCRCVECGRTYPAEELLMERLPPRCECGGVLKPDFVMFGEPIPADAVRDAEREAERADVLLVIGTTGEVYPAALVPSLAKETVATIVEINPEPSAHTGAVTDVHVRLSAVEAAKTLGL
jgi:NAD-dependent deacetylase